MTVIKEPLARAEQAPVPRYSLAHVDSVSVRWPRSLKPLLILGLLVGVVVAVAAVTQACNNALVCAPGVLYPAAQSVLHVSLITHLHNDQRVAEVLKHDGEAVRAGEKLLRLESASEEAQLEQVRKRVETCLQRLKECELQRKEAGSSGTAAGSGAQQRVLESDLGRARLEERRLNKAIEDRVLRAPISGVLRHFNVQNGEWVSRRAALGWICDTSSLLFRAEVRQRDLARIHVGQRARVYFNASNGEKALYEAEVAEIGEFIEASNKESSDPLALFPTPPSRAVMLPEAQVRLRILSASGHGLEEGGADVSSASAGGALRPGCVGQARILVGDGKLAEWFFNWRPYSAVPTVYYVDKRSKGEDMAAEPTKKKKKS